MKDTLGLSDTAPFVQSGFLGVDLFFILSGAVMYHVHASDFLHYTVKSHLAFLKLRFARVYPLHIFCLLAFAAIVYVLPEFRENYRPNAYSLSNFIATLFLVNNWGLIPTTLWNGPTWSLSAEWLGYISFPLVVISINKFIPRGREFATAFALLTILIGAVIALDAPNLGQLNRIGILRMAFEFSAGCLLYKAAVNSPMNKSWTISIAVAIILGCSYRLDYHWGAVFGLGLLVFSLCQNGQVANLIFGNKYTLWLGNISFSLYLSHWPLIQIYQWSYSHLDVDRPVLAVFLVAAIIAVPVLLYRFVEVPSRRFLRQKLQSGSAREFNHLTSTKA